MTSNQTSTIISIPLSQQIYALSHQLDRLTQSVLHLEQREPELYHGLLEVGGRLNRLGRQIAQREEEQQDLLALADIGQVVNSSLEPDEVLRIVMDTIVQLSGAERGFLMLRDDDGELRVRTARNWERETIDPSENSISRTVVNRVISEGSPVLTTNAQEDPRFRRQESVATHNLRSILCVPLKSKDELIGVIYADHRVRKGIFTEAERHLLKAFANQAAVAIENARLFESVRKSLAEVTALKNLMVDVLASITSGVLTIDLQEQITLCNRAAASILGYASSEIVGRPLKEFLFPMGNGLHAKIETVYRESQPLGDLEYAADVPSRGKVDLRLNISPLKDTSEATRGIVLVMDDLTEQKRLRAFHDLFERMVSPAVIAKLNPEQLRLGGERTQLTTLFADLRGFTQFGELLDPETLVRVLNIYLGAAIGAILAQEGTLDKFLGDAVMAFFNAPVPQPDHTLRAVRAALGLRAAVQTLHRELPPRLRLWFGIGIHAGEALLGMIGTERRLEYTAIGDSVNTARRLQEHASPDQILISAQAYQQIREQVIARRGDPYFAKGKSHPIDVYEVVGMR